MKKMWQIPIYNKAYDRAYIKAMLERCTENGGSYDSHKYRYVLAGGVMAIDSFVRIPLKASRRKDIVTLATYQWTGIETRGFMLSQEDIDAATEAANR